MWGLGVLISLLGAGALRVIQEPDELQVTEGDTATLGCQVEMAESGVQLRLEWGVQLAWHPPRATLSLPQVQENDSGLYICQVILEIPRHGTATGNGTELRVTPAAPGGHRAALLWGLVGSLGGIILLLGMALLGYRCCHRSPDTAIYVNVVSGSARDPKEPPPPEQQQNPYQRARVPAVPPRP